MRSVAKLLVLGAGLLWTTTAAAQTHTSEVRIDQMQPASAGSPFTRAEGPHARFDDGIEYAFRLTGDYALEPLRSGVINGQPNIVGQTSDKAIVQHAALLHVGASLSPLHWLNFDLNFPFAVYETGDADLSVNSQELQPGKGGIGDLRIGAYGRPINSKKFDLALGARFWAPSGTPEAYMSGRDRGFRLEVAAAIAGEIDVLLYGCTAGIAPLFFAGRDGDRVALSCAAHFKLAPVVSLGLEPHVAAFSYATDRNNSVADLDGLGSAHVAVQFEPMAGFNFYLGDFTLGLTGGTGLGGAPGTAKARGLLTLTYAALGERVVEEGEEDTDLDGVADDYDACPKEAGPRERRGCPSKRDEDGDGIIEGDACPNEPGARYDDPKANGCPDGDNDHTADPVDACPLQPGSDNGCPKYARLIDGEFVIDPPLSFSKRSSSLSAEAVATLEEILQTMRADPKLEQVSVTVGGKGVPTQLTDMRAKALHDLFNEQNFPSARYEIVLGDDLAAGQVTVRVIR